jgi:CHAT domain-containing protein/Flp pilus assembly protein TadD
MRTTRFAAGLGLALVLLGMAVPGFGGQIRTFAQSTITQNRKGEGERLLQKGRELSEKGEYKAALELFQQALQIYQQIQDQVGEAITLNELGRVYEGLLDYTRMGEAYQKALVLARATQNSNEEGSSLNGVGDIYYYKAEYVKAREIFQQALIIFKATGNRKGEAQSLHNIGTVYAALGQQQKALEYYSQALPLRRMTGDLRGEGATLSNIGEFYAALGEKPKALEFFNQALPLSRAVGDRRDEAITLNRIGNVYSALSEKQKALEYYNRALPLSRAVGDRAVEAATLSNIGGGYAALGQQQKALEYYNQALPLSRAVGDRGGEANILTSIGRVYADLGEKQKALEYYNQALPLSRAVGDRGGEANILTNIGGVYYAVGEQQKALEYFNQALPLSRALGDRRGEATTLNNIGLVYNAVREQQKALVFFNQALPLYRIVGNRWGEATTLNNIGGIYYALGEQQKALDFFNQALPLSRAVGDRGGEANALGNIGYLLKTQKQPELAIVFYKQSVNVYESLRTSNRTLPRDLQISFNKTFARIYESLANLLIKQGRLPEAQAVLELLQLKELRDYTRDAKLQNSGISLTAEEQKAFNQILKDYTTINQFATAIAKCEAERCNQLQKLRDQRDQLNAAIYRVFDQLRTTLASQALDPSQINTEELNEAAREIVTAQPGTVLVYPIVQENKIQFLLAFQAGNGAVVFKPVEGATVPSETLFAIASTLRDQLRTPHSNLKQLQTTSQKLYDWLIKPLEPEINRGNVKHLVFASDRATRYIPLAALYDGKEYLINKPYTLSIVLSASTTRPKAPRPTPNVLAAGATTFSNAPPLNFVGQELNAIVKTKDNPHGIFPGNELLNQQFDFASLKATLSDRTFTFLHIATHGILDPGNIDNSYLLPGKGDFITKAKIRELGNSGLDNVHLVVLSACNTAVGTSATRSDTAGQRLELSGISYYFMQGGVKAVLASLWSVNDSSTALMMQHFYYHLAQGKSKGEALREAQRDLLNLKDEAAVQRAVSSLPRASARPVLPPGSVSAPGYTHPYYWAPFILIGNNL